MVFDADIAELVPPWASVIDGGGTSCLAARIRRRNLEMTELYDLSPTMGAFRLILFSSGRYKASTHEVRRFFDLMMMELQTLQLFGPT
jgi:hypothetical protein